MLIIIQIISTQVKSSFPEQQQQQQKLFTEFIVNINTCAEKKSPHFSLTSVCQIIKQDSKDSQQTLNGPQKLQQDQNSQLQKSQLNKKGGQTNQDDNNETNQEEDQQNGQYLIALKTEKTVAIISLNRGEAKLLSTMEISDKFIQKKNICFHSFVYSSIIDNSQLQDSINQTSNKISNSSQRSSVYQNPEQSSSSLSHNIPDSPDIYICFQTGYILVMNCISSHFLYNFNLLNEKADQIWHQRRITKICTMPDQKNFLVLFADSVIVQYGLNSKKENYEFQADINKLEAQISFQPKKFCNLIQRKSHGSFEYSTIIDKDFVGFACYQNDEESFCGPHKYFKFKCPSISDFTILPYSHPFYKLVQKKQPREPLLIAYSGLDGLFRVVDIINFKPIYCFKSYYGGINSFSLDNGFENSPLISLACQDDSVLLLNIRLNTYVRIIGHSSFVSYSIFTPITQKITRITAGSYDGCISITDLLRAKLDNPEKEAVNNESNIPIKVKYQNDKAETVQLNHVQKMNDEGVAYILGFQDYFLTSSFDGCASLFKYHNQVPPAIQQQMDQNENEQNQETSQNQQDRQRNDSNQNPQGQPSNLYQQMQQKYSGPRKDSTGYSNQSQGHNRQRQEEEQQFNNNSQYRAKNKSQQQNKQNNQEEEDEEERRDQYKNNKGSQNQQHKQQDDYQQQSKNNNSGYYQKRDKRNSYERN